MVYCLPLCACICLLGASVLLTGCGSGSKKVTVLVVRHCIRSTPEDGIDDIPGLDYFNNYSGTPWPPFGVHEYYCLDRGRQIIEGTGKWLKDHGNLPMPVQVVADDVERDRVTGLALLSGLLGKRAYSGDEYSVHHAPFTAASSCKFPSSGEVAAAIAAQMEAIPMSGTESGALKEVLAEILKATGKAAKWETTGCVPNKTSGRLSGSCNAASEFLERFTMEWGGGLEVAWGRLGLDKLPILLKLHTWYRLVTTGVPQLVARDQASIARAVSASLKSRPTGDVTRIFVGHDTQLNALNGVLGLVWTPGSFPVNATLPGSALRFDRDGDTVTMSYVFPTNFSDEGNAMGSMTSVPATLQTSGKNTISVGDLQSMLEKGSALECANPWTPEQQGTNNLQTEQTIGHLTRFAEAHSENGIVV